MQSNGSMTKRPKDNKVGPWAEEKLDSLRRGLHYYTTYLKNQPYWRKVYIDAFAGPGLSEVRTRPKDERPSSLTAGDLLAMLANEDAPDPVEEEVRFLKGSPRIALDLQNPFDRYIFIERDPKRLTELAAMKDEFGARRNIEIFPGDANAILLEFLQAGFSKSTHRAYVFLDPFGIQVPWSTIEALAATKAIEVLINFPMGMAIRRMMPRSGDIPDGWGISLDAFFGSPDWRLHAYKETRSLFGQQSSKLIDSEVRLLEWYRERLRDAFGFVSEAQLITNTRGGRLYYLIWAGPRQEGLKGANYILTMKRSRSRTL
jgi:three-Cys-motif partner protein